MLKDRTYETKGSITTKGKITTEQNGVAEKRSENCGPAVAAASTLSENIVTGWGSFEGVYLCSRAN